MNSTNRPFFTSPAVHPSPEVSSIALVDALIAISNAIIAMRSNSFPIHRINVGRIIRLTELLFHYFQEIIDSESIVVCLSELYITLQRVKYLVEDCSRPGARLWSLARSERASGEFRLLIKSVSTVVDALQVSDIDKSLDTEDLLRLIGEQSWKVVVETEPADAQIVRLLWSVLDQFKNGVAPSKAELRRIVDHLGVKNWGECSEEISFLEEMIDGGNGDDRGTSLASSLIGFMVYCRVVLFDDIEQSQDSVKYSKICKSKAVDGINEDNLRCPISLEIMMDPVTVATGQTYDRISISKWFKTGGVTCPITGETLDEAAFVPNLNLSTVIQNYCRKNNMPFTMQRNQNKQGNSKTESVGSSVNAEALRLTAKFLVGSLKYGSNQEKKKASFEIRKLSKFNVSSRDCFVEAGAVPWLLDLFASFDSAVQNNAVAALLNLSKNESGRTAIIKAGGLSLVIDMLKLGTKVGARKNAAAILYYISSVTKYRIEIGDVQKVIPSLVELLSGGTCQAKKNAAATLYGLLLHPDNHQKALESGAVAALTKLLLSKNDDLIYESLKILAKIAERHEGATEILNSTALPQLVNALRLTTSRSVQECCISLLLSLCNSGGDEVIRLLNQMPMFIPSLYSLINEGSPQASKKAKILLKYIHLLNKPDYPALIAPLVQDHLVRAQ